MSQLTETWRSFGARFFQNSLTRLAALSCAFEDGVKKRCSGSIVSPSP